MRSEPLLFSANDLDGLRHWLRNGRKRLKRWREGRVGLRGLFVYGLSAPLALAALISLVSGNLQAMSGSAVAFCMVVLGARLNRLGLVERLIAPERRFTKTGRFPHQYFAVLLIASATLLAAYALVGHGLMMSTVYGLLAAFGFHFLYRLPALRISLPQAPKKSFDPKTRRALEQGEQQLLAIEKAAMAVGNAELEQRLHQIAAKGRGILDLLSERPTDLFRARRFLNVHLEGAERVAVRYAKAHRLVRGGILENKFRDVLIQIDSAFERQHRQLLDHDVTDLDVHIDVLRKQLQREGLA